ncbi:uncharacterized protein LOC121420981 [Lytechinus variegatus]|uniref:uncharacterized protein LOC121420981 n=1 Tax=Lytechinus variegatus TaxID=7654 RepID=UPI001BB22047|nr:uncharacterized protein LOC121420981 [Lytechinus variegatus]
MSGGGHQASFQGFGKGNGRQQTMQMRGGSSASSSSSSMSSNTTRLPSGMMASSYSSSSSSSSGPCQIGQGLLGENAGSVASALAATMEAASKAAAAGQGQQMTVTTETSTSQVPSLSDGTSQMMTTVTTRKMSMSSGGTMGTIAEMPPFPGSMQGSTHLASPVSSANIQELNRIHKAGNADVSRFTTEDFGMCHRHLSDSVTLSRFRSKNNNQKGENGDKRDNMIKLAERIMNTVLQAESFAEVNVLMNLRELSAIGRVDRISCQFAKIATEKGFADFFATVWLKLNQIDIKDQLTYPGQYIAVNLLLDATQRFTEVNQALCKDMGRRCLPALLSILNDPFYSCDALNGDDEQTRWMSRKEFLKKIFSIICNCLRNYPDNREVLRMHNAASYIQTFLESNSYVLRAKALNILAYIVTEDENDKLNTSPKNAEFMVNVLQSTLADDKEKSDHYSPNTDHFAIEVVEAIQHLAANDGNKRKFVQAGILPHLGSLIDGWDDERKEALQTLWILSFNQDNKEDIKKEKKCMEAVQRLAQNEASSRQCQSILWNVGALTSDQLAKQGAINGKGQTAGKGSTSSNGGKQSLTNYVMLSYQWDVQREILAVNELLKANGFEVWIDVEQMGGSTLEAMAHAVENAAVVVLCFSEKYKDSPACRTEAEYTYKLRKPVVPLKMQNGYDPNGWLGAMLGTKFYIEMYKLDLVDKNGHLLIRELANRGCKSSGDGGGSKAVAGKTSSDEDKSGETDESNGLPAGVVPVEKSPEAAHHRANGGFAGVPTTSWKGLAPVCSSNVIKWTNQQALYWIEENGFPRLTPWFKGWDGEDLLGLKEMSISAPLVFYRKMESEFGLKKTLELVRFKRLLDKII